MTRYSLEPFMALTGWGMRRIQDVAPCNGEEWRLRKSDGVTQRIAERLAHAAGRHEYEIWPELLDEAIEKNERACEECGEPFIPTRRTHRMCSKACRNRRHARRRYWADEEYRRRKLDYRRVYYKNAAEWERSEARRRYWADPEAERARKRREYAMSVTPARENGGDEKTPGVLKTRPGASDNRGGESLMDTVHGPSDRNGQG